MFELKFVISGKTPDRRYTQLSSFEQELRKEFPDSIVDISRWPEDTRESAYEWLVSINYTARNPNKIRIFVSHKMRQKIISLTNIVTGASYPLTRTRKRKAY
jgi:hypothetical protein